jgi:hypothetical protein
MDLTALRSEAEKQVVLEYDAWAEIDGAVRESIIIKKMLQLLESQDKSAFEAKLLVARAAWETKAFSWGSEETMASFLCEAGGKYRNANGFPSGAAYDMANYVSIVWDALDSMGQDPVGIAVSGWSKARVLVATVRQHTKLLDHEGKEVTSAEKASKVEVTNSEPITQALVLATDEDTSWAEMTHQLQQRRVPPFKFIAKLRKDGLWDVGGTITDQQFSLVQRLLANHMEVELR